MDIFRDHGDIVFFISLERKGKWVPYLDSSGEIKEMTMEFLDWNLFKIAVVLYLNPGEMFYQLESDKVTYNKETKIIVF